MAVAMLLFTSCAKEDLNPNQALSADIDARFERMMDEFEDAAKAQVMASPQYAEMVANDNLPASLYQFNIVRKALRTAGLIPTVVQGGITIFAPSDFAWNQEGVNLNNVNNVNNLNSLLLYHAVDGTVLSSDLQNGTIQTIFGENINITLPAGNDLDWDDLPTINNDAYIYIYDEVRRGTTFHGISEVLDQFHPLD
jgi:uncharacterized surface protein with fasciclin (FAS1) repeats